MGIPQREQDRWYIGAGTDRTGSSRGLTDYRENPEKPTRPRFIGADTVAKGRILALFCTRLGHVSVITRNLVCKSAEMLGGRFQNAIILFIWQQPWLIAAPEKSKEFWYETIKL